MSRRIVKIFLLLTWLIIGTFLYAFVFVRLGDHLPAFPEFSEKLFLCIFSSDEIGAEGYQDIYLFSGSFFYVSIFTLVAFAGYYAYKHLRNKLR